ncbi:MAG: hypothetical protein KKA07_03785 [Bacteroidetes bacterium]|nr:hypothetical protein [Bacteroidota bacterium]MBU1718175.1 hypothetical protein [Bacteroidota bacterium]
MKLKHLLPVCLVAIFCLIQSNGIAQEKIKVTDTREDFNDQRADALVVEIYEADASFVEKEWRKLMKDFNAKVSSKKVIFADNALVKTLSDNTVDIYAKVSQMKDGKVQLIVGFDLGGAFLNKAQHASKYNAAEKILYDFAVSVSKNAVGEKVEEAQKEFSKREKALEALKKDNERLHSDIEKYKKQIEDAEGNIEKNVKDQEEATKAIEEQKTFLELLQEKEKAIK